MPYGGGGYTVPQRRVQVDPMAFQNAFNQTRQGISQNAILDLQMEQAKQVRQREQQTPGALAGYLQGEQDDADLAGLARINPTVAVQQQQIRSTEGTKKAKQLKEALGIATAVLPNLTVDVYPAFREDMKSRGVPEYVLPQGFGRPEEFEMWKRKAFQEALSSKEQLEIQLKKLEVDEKLAARARPDFVGGVHQTEDGFAAFDRRGQQMVPIPGAKPKGGTGDSITLADGTRIDLKGGAGANKDTGLQKPTMNKVEEDLLNATASMASITEVENRLKPEFQTLWSRLSAGGKSVWNKLGGELDPESEQAMTEFRQARAAAGQLLADELKAMSGAAITPQEAERSKEFIPNPGTGLMDGDAPIDIKSKIERFKAFKRRAIARLNYIRKNGMSIKEMDRIPLEMVDTFIANRMSQTREKLAAQNPNATPEEIKEQSMKAVAEEFGLVY